MGKRIELFIITYWLDTRNFVIRIIFGFAKQRVQTSVRLHDIIYMTRFDSIQKKGVNDEIISNICKPKTSRFISAEISILKLDVIVVFYSTVVCVCMCVVYAYMFTHSEKNIFNVIIKMFSESFGMFKINCRKVSIVNREQSSHTQDAQSYQSVWHEQDCGNTVAYGALYMIWYTFKCSKLNLPSGYSKVTIIKERRSSNINNNNNNNNPAMYIRWKMTITTKYIEWRLWIAFSKNLAKSF